MNEANPSRQLISPLRQEYDVLVIGSGGAGAAAAESAAAQGARVLMVSKDPIVCSDSKISEGIITVRGSGSDRDSEQTLAANVRIQGDDLGEPTLARGFAQDSKAAYQWLSEHGIKSTRKPDEGQPQAMSIAMGGHTLPRSVDHANGGLDYSHACWSAITQGQIDYLEDAWCLDVYSAAASDTTEDMAASARRVHGGLIYHASSGDFISVKAQAVVIACGGLSSMYFPNTDTMKGNTGDAYAIAARAGAQLIDMEQVQFIPFAVSHPPSYQGLVIGEPISAGALGVIRDANDKILKAEIMGRTRAECAAVIARAAADGRASDNGSCYLDLSENIRGESGRVFVELMQNKIPGLLKIVRAAMGPKAAQFKQAWQVRPSAHYLMGGVQASELGEALDCQQQKIAGLYVAGQALGGLHGSNRLGSTSLAEAIIFGRRAGKAAHQFGEQNKNLSWNDIAELEAQVLTGYSDLFNQPSRVSSKTYPITISRQLQKAAWQGIGPGRTVTGVAQALSQFEVYQQQLQDCHIDTDPIWNQSFMDYIECRNMLFCAQAVARSAQLRTHSVGAHVQLDEIKPSLWRATPGPYSSAISHQQGELKARKLDRQASPWLARNKIALQQNGKILMFKIIRRLPFKLRDKILYRIYHRALGQPDQVAEAAATKNTQNISEAGQ